MAARYDDVLFSVHVDRRWFKTGIRLMGRCENDRRQVYCHGF